MLKDILKPKSEAEILNSIQQIVCPVKRFCYNFKFHYEKHYEHVEFYSIEHHSNFTQIISIICKYLENTEITYTISYSNPMTFGFDHRKFEKVNPSKIEIIVSSVPNMFSEVNHIELSRLIIIYGDKVYLEG